MPASCILLTGKVGFRGLSSYPRWNDGDCRLHIPARRAAAQVQLRSNHQWWHAIWLTPPLGKEDRLVSFVEIHLLATLLTSMAGQEATLFRETQYCLPPFDQRFNDFLAQALESHLANH